MLLDPRIDAHTFSYLVSEHLHAARLSLLERFGFASRQRRICQSGVLGFLYCVIVWGSDDYIRRRARTKSLPAVGMRCYSRAGQAVVESRSSPASVQVDKPGDGTM